MRSKRPRLPAAALALAVAAQAPGGPPPDDRRAEGAAAFTRQQAEAWTAGLVPVVERVAGRRFRQVPRVAVVERSGLEAALARVYLEELGREMEGVDVSLLAERARDLALAQAPAVLGLYEPSVRCVFLAPANLLPIVERLDGGADQCEPLAKVVIAHELTHALQDQELDLGSHTAAAPDAEALEALWAALEGHAVLVADEVGRELRLDEARLELARALSAGAADTGGPFGKARKLAALRFERRYVAGSAFVRHHAARGGAEEVWRVLRDPPRRLSVILRPESWGEPEPPPADRAQVLQAVQDGLGADFDQVERERPLPGSGSGLAGFAHLPAETLLDLGVWLRHLEVRRFRSGADGAGGELTLYVFAEGSDWPRTMVELREAAVRDGLERRQRSGAVSIERVRAGAPDVPGADAARSIAWLFRMNGLETRPSLWIAAARGRFVLELALHHRDPGDERAAALLAEALSRCAAP